MYFGAEIAAVVHGREIQLLLAERTLQSGIMLRLLFFFSFLIKHPEKWVPAVPVQGQVTYLVGLYCVITDKQRSLIGTVSCKSMGLQPEVVGFEVFFSASYGSTEILRFLSKSRKCAVVTIIVPLENAEDLLALQCASLLFYSKTHSDLLEPDIIGAISVRD